MRTLWLLSGTAVLVGFIASAAVFVLNWSGDSEETPASPGLNYECRDEATRAALRAIPRGAGGEEWIGNVVIALPPDAIGHDLIVAGSWKNGVVGMGVGVREGVPFRTVTMDGIELRTSERLTFDYAGAGYVQGPVTYDRRGENRGFGGAFASQRLVSTA